MPDAYGSGCSNDPILMWGLYSQYKSTVGTERKDTLLPLRPAISMPVPSAEGVSEQSTALCVHNGHRPERTQT